VCEFLRFGSAHGWVPQHTVVMLAAPKYLKHLPPGFDSDEQDQFRTVSAAAFRFRVAEPGYETLAVEQVSRMIELTRNARDGFLIALLGCTGMRIGEALGLRCEDMHLLPNSHVLGCAVKGPHVHVRRRQDNGNQALAKARKPRSIPVTDELVAFYSDYRYERDQVEQAIDCDLVFVNLFRPPLGRPMTYDDAKDMSTGQRRGVYRSAAHAPPRRCNTVDPRRGRSGRRAGTTGACSQASLQPYVHVSDQDKRDAVGRVASTCQEAP
jgi:integrase/recombinase XerD